MEKHLVINFEKTGLTLDSLIQVFTSQKVLKLEIVPPLVNTDNTKKCDVFINSFKWTGTRSCELIFTTLFKFDWMIPGLYKINLEEDDLSNHNQKWADMLPIKS